MPRTASWTLELSPASDGLRVVFGVTGAGCWGSWTTPIDLAGLDDLAQAVLSAVARTTRRGRARGGAEEGLVSAGAALADGALPAEIKAALAAAAPGSALRLVVHADAARIPWEAMAVGDGLLAERFDVGRHVALSEARAMAAQPGGTRVLVVANPASDLPHARREGEAIAGLLGAGDSGCSVVLRAGPVRRVELLAALRECDALHFAGHADPEGWRMADGHLTRADAEALAGGASRPGLVFAHACRSADPTEGRDGVLRGLLKAGCAQTVGALWDIPDESAPEAASAFWRAVTTGAGSGAAVRAARTAAGLVGGTAYVLHGDPVAPPMPAIMSCGACGTPAAASGSRFCDRCGAPLPIAERAGEERRTVTVVSVGVDPGDDADAEEVHRRLNAEYARIAEVVRRYGGSVDRFAGDAVVAVFGAPHAHENDPERAALAAREIVAERSGGVLARAGVETGIAVIGGLGDAHRRDHGLAGAVLLEAGRLMRAARPGQVLCGPEAARRLAGAVRTAPAGGRAAQGARRILGPKAAADRRQRRRFGGPLPLVGRRDELARVRTAYGSVRADRRPGGVTIAGPAGIGKSRLFDEMLAEVREGVSPPRIALGAALPYEGGDPYGPVASLLRELLGLSEGATPAAVVRALDEAEAEDQAQSRDDDLPDWVPRTGGAGPHDDEDRRALALLLGAEAPHGDADAAALHGRIPVAVQRLVERLAASRPLVLGFIDMQWAPDATLDVLEDLGRFLADVPVLMVTLARPGLFERRPHLGEGRAEHVRIDLKPLDEQACRDLVQAIAQRGGAVADAAGTAAIERSDGNPLFLEELVKDHLESGGGPDITGVPETLEGVLAARLDRCGESERAILRRAAVLGRTFWRGALETMGAPGDVAAALQDLRGRGILLRRSPSRIAGDEEFLFKHALLRDVAYIRIGRDERGSLHRAAAAWYDGLPAAEEHLDARAEHHERAGDSPGAARLRAQAAARAAAARSDREAQAHYRAALRLLGDIDDSGVLREGLADSLTRTGDWDEALALYSAVRDEAADPARVAELRRREAGVHDARGAFDEALACLDEADATFPPPEIAARLRADRGWTLFRLGQLEEAGKVCVQALKLLGDAGPARDRAQLHSLLGGLAYGRGDHDEAVTQHEAALALREAEGDKAGMSKSYNNLGIVAERRGDDDAAARWHARSIRLKAAAGDRPGLASAYNNLGALYWRRGDLDRAASALGASLDLKQRLGNRWGEAVTLANLAEVLFDSGDLQGCQTRLSESEAACGDVGNRSLLPEIRRLQAQVAQADGDAEQAADKARAAVELARDNADTLREGVALRVLGEVTSDAEALAQAVRLLDAAEDRAEADRARAALAALPPAATLDDDSTEAV